MGLWALGLVLAILTIVLVSTSTVLWLPVNTAPNSIDTKLSTNLMIALGVSIAVLVGMISAMMYSYFRVKCTVRQHKQQLIQMLGQENLNTEMRLTRMFVLVVLCFVVTTFPYLIYGIMYSVKGENNYIIETVAYAALPFSHVVNPVIYAQFVVWTVASHGEKAQDLIWLSDPTSSPRNANECGSLVVLPCSWLVPGSLSVRPCFSGHGGGRRGEGGGWWKG